MIDVASMHQSRTIAVKFALEYANLAADGTLFVNDEDANEMEVVDVRSGRVGKAIAMPGAKLRVASPMTTGLIASLQPARTERPRSSTPRPAVSWTMSRQAEASML